LLKFVSDETEFYKIGHLAFAHRAHSGRRITAAAGGSVGHHGGGDDVDRDGHGGGSGLGGSMIRPEKVKRKVVKDRCSVLKEGIDLGESIFIYFFLFRKNSRTVLYVYTETTISKAYPGVNVM
jgi:hypothetical protein